jgi:Xaa-Pro dipeptidase
MTDSLADGVEMEMVAAAHHTDGDPVKNAAPIWEDLNMTGASSGPDAGTAAKGRLFDYARLSQLMDRESVDVLLASTQHSVGQFSGYIENDLDEHHNLWYPDVSYAQMCGVPRDEAKGAFLVLPAISSTGVAAQDPWITDRRFWGPGNYIRTWKTARPDGGRPTDDVVRALTDRGLQDSRIAIEKRYLPVEYYEQLREQLPGATFIDARTIITRLRAVKTDEEIRRIREGCARSARAFNAMRQVLHLGMTSEELRRLWIEEFAHLGLTWARGVIYFGPAGTVLKGGPPGPSHNPLRPGHAIRADVCGRYMGYVSDLSRVFGYQQVDPEIEHIHETLRGILGAMIAAARPGVQLGELRRLEVDLYRQAGHSPIVSFGGHSFGRAIHEWPYLESIEDVVFEPGMVTTIEPQILFSSAEGDINLSLEEDILITPTGSEVLSSAAAVSLYQ